MHTDANGAVWGASQLRVACKPPASKAPLPGPLPIRPCPAGRHKHDCKVCNDASQPGGRTAGGAPHSAGAPRQLSRALGSGTPAL